MQTVNLKAVSIVAGVIGGAAAAGVALCLLLLLSIGAADQFVSPLEVGSVRFGEPAIVLDGGKEETSVRTGEGMTLFHVVRFRERADGSTGFVRREGYTVGIRWARAGLLLGAAAIVGYLGAVQTTRVVVWSVRVQWPVRRGFPIGSPREG